MSFWDNVKKFAQPYADDDYDDYEDEEMEEFYINGIYFKDSADIDEFIKYALCCLEVFELKV